MTPAPTPAMPQIAANVQAAVTGAIERVRTVVSGVGTARRAAATGMQLGTGTFLENIQKRRAENGGIIGMGLLKGVFPATAPTAAPPVAPAPVAPTPAPAPAPALVTGVTAAPEPSLIQVGETRISIGSG